MSESEKKISGDGFSIQFEVSDSNEIPGVTELLKSKKEMKSLKEFGTKLEIHFLLKKGEDHYLYIQHSDLSASRFVGLDELYDHMKIPVAFVKTFGAFGECISLEKKFLFEAFGITEQKYLQIVPNQAGKILTVYISEKSMSARKSDVISYTENKNWNIGASGLEFDPAA